MLDEKEAKRIGVQACVEKIGLEFCKKYEENAHMSPLRNLWAFLFSLLF